MQSFLLGLANGTTCLAYCAPVLIPFMLGKGQPTRRNWLLLAQFLGGRMGGYLLFGLLAWAAGQLIQPGEAWRGLVYGAAYLGLAGLLLFSTFVRTPAPCAGSAPRLRRWLRGAPALLPAALGFFTGLNLCPPFLLAFAGAAENASLAASLLFFLLFFIGTSLYFIPLPLVGLLSRHNDLRWIGKVAAALVAAYYLYSGLISLIGGIQIL